MATYNVLYGDRSISAVNCSFVSNIAGNAIDSGTNGLDSPSNGGSLRLERISLSRNTFFEREVEILSSHEVYSDDHSLEVWDGDSKTLKSVLPLSEAPKSLFYSGDDSWLLGMKMVRRKAPMTSACKVAARMPQ